MHPCDYLSSLVMASMKEDGKSFIVVVTFDLHGAHPNHYPLVKRWLAKLDLIKQIRAPGRPLRQLPANTFVAKIKRDRRTKHLRQEIQAAIKMLFRLKGLDATLFVVVAQKWSWGHSRV
jgi:hypothetical protein